MFYLRDDKVYYDKFEITSKFVKVLNNLCNRNSNGSLFNFKYDSIKYYLYFVDDRKILLFKQFLERDDRFFKYKVNRYLNSREINDYDYYNDDY